MQDPIVKFSYFSVIHTMKKNWKNEREGEVIHFFFVKWKFYTIISDNENNI